MTLRARLHRQLHIGSWPNGRLTGLNIFVVWTILLVSVDKESPSENAIYWIGTGPTPRHIY